ncbi:HXXEE domain-containing protein [Lysinibacillus parviboronicapiens]|uniref:HXXEE domain-containing protein n=1 Tax=Lysinibacillus parviboronicapiens TaxID=436516 RepID=UPI00142E7983|nr:HXXEE domain-containing protein [Lysinibacillus parviboronicapiens]
MEMSFNVHTLIWLFPIFFIIHDFEEIIMVEKWLTKNRNKLYERLPAKIADRIVKQFSMSTAQFAVAVLFIFLFVSLSTIMANQYLINGIAINIYFFTAITLVFFIHAFSHIGQSILFRSITPGAITSVIIILPYSFVLYKSLFIQEIITWKIILISLPFGILFFPVVLTAHWLGKKVI